jgi:SusD family.
MSHSKKTETAMKKINIWILAASVLLLGVTTSCELDEENPSGDTELAWSSIAGYTKKINDCYFDLVRVIYGQAEDSFLLEAEGGTDIWADVNENGTNGNYSKLMRYEDFGAACNLMNEGYDGFYGVIHACNGAIAYQDQVTDAPKETVYKLAAEAHFIRAHALFNIVEHRGGKYLPLEPVTGEIKSLPLSSVNDFYNVILSDLEFAMQWLPVTQSNQGHVKRAAAYHLYAKACMTYSTYTDKISNVVPISATESEELLKKAKKAIDELIDHAADYDTQLYTEAKDIFAEKNNKHNKEAFFVISHDETELSLNPRGNYPNRTWKKYCAYNNDKAGIYIEGLEPSVKSTPKVLKGDCIMEPTKYMYDLYSNPNDERFDAFFKVVYYCNKATNPEKTGYRWIDADANRYGMNDGRVGNAAYDVMVGDTIVYLSRTPLTDAEKKKHKYAVYNIDDNYLDPARPKRFFPTLIKGDCMVPDYLTNPNKAYNASDHLVYRLGESYLVSAEIEWRLGNKGAAVNRINTLRNRACKNHDGSLDINESQLTQDFLLDEYAREMIGEWNRWMTLKRFRAFESRLVHNPQIKSFNPAVHYLRPISSKEILLIDNGAEYQNPGY